VHGILIALATKCTRNFPLYVYTVRENTLGLIPESYTVFLCVALKMIDSCLPLERTSCLRIYEKAHSTCWKRWLKIVQYNKTTSPPTPLALYNM